MIRVHGNVYVVDGESPGGELKMCMHARISPLAIAIHKHCTCTAAFVAKE